MRARGERRGVRALLAFAVLVVPVPEAPGARAAEDSVVARLSPRTITVGEQARIELDVFGECAVDPEPLLPEIDGLELTVLSGPEFSVRSGTAATGGQEYIASYRVGVVARRAGRFAIEGLGVVCQSAHRIDANRVDLTAVAATDAPPVRLALEPATALVWARQPFRVRVRLELDARISNALTSSEARFVLPWWDDVVARVEGTALTPGTGARKRYEIEGAGRSIHLEVAERPREAGGAVYDVLTAELQLLAPEPGPLTFGGTRFECRLPRGTGTQVGGDAAGRPFEALAEVALVTVREVPREGRPAAYGTAVGGFSVDVDVDRRQARVGDPVIVTLSIRETTSGTTNLPWAEFPGLDRAAGFKSFEHRTWMEDGVRRVRLGLLPESTAVDAVPPFTIHWFDPTSATYERASTDAVPLEVTPHPEHRTLEAPPSPPSAWRLWPLGVLVLFLGVLLWIARRTSRTGPARTDVEDEQRRRERRRTALARLEAASPTDDPVAEARALARYLADRFDAEPGRCFGADAAQVLEAAGADERTVRDVADWFEAKERAAFGGAGAGEGAGEGESAVEMGRRLEGRLEVGGGRLEVGGGRLEGRG